MSKEVLFTGQVLDPLGSGGECVCGGEGGGRGEEWGWLILELEFAGAKMGVANHGNSCHFSKANTVT